MVAREEFISVLFEVRGGGGDVCCGGACIIDATEGVLGAFFEAMMRVGDCCDEGTEVTDLLEHRFIGGVGRFGGIVVKEAGRRAWG